MTIGKTARKTRLRPGVSTNARSRKMPERAGRRCLHRAAPGVSGLHPWRAPYVPRYRETRVSTPICASRCHSGSSWARAVCASAHSRSASSGRARAPGAVQQRLREGLGVVGHGHGLRPRAQARQVGRDRAPAQAGVLEDAVGQGGVVEGLDLERHDADVGAQDQAGGGLVLHAPQPHEVRRRAAEGEVRVVAALLLVPLADEQQHEPVAEALADRAQQRPVGAPAEVADRDGDDVAALRRREGVGGERHGDRAAPGDALEARELLGGGDDRRRALGRLLVQDLQALALLVGGVVGALEAIPAPVPQLAAGAQAHDRARRAGTAACGR